MIRAEVDRILAGALAHIEAWKNTLLPQAGKGVIVEGRQVTLQPRSVEAPPVYEPVLSDLWIWTRLDGQVNGEPLQLDWEASAVIYGATKQLQVLSGHLARNQLSESEAFSRSYSIEAEARLHPPRGVGLRPPPAERTTATLYSTRLTLQLTEREEFPPFSLITTHEMSAPGSQRFECSSPGILTEITLTAITF